MRILTATQLIEELEKSTITAWMKVSQDNDYEYGQELDNDALIDYLKSEIKSHNGNDFETDVKRFNSGVLEVTFRSTRK
jgi:hypothetical protein